MTLLHIFVFTAAAFPYHLLVPSRWRVYALLGMSLVAVYWLSPPLGLFPGDGMVLASLALALAVIVWMLTRSRAGDSPDAADRNRLPLLVMIGLLVVLLVVLKTPALAVGAADALGSLVPAENGQIAGVPLTWIGFSYLAFRLIHLLRDRLTGRLPDLSLAEAITYALFFPAFTAGPIDRAERFVGDLRALPSMERFSARHLLAGGWRITLGLFKKFVVADLLALFALSDRLLPQFEDPSSLWIALFAYGFRIFFDFSGYSDIAIGLGYLYGITLPENFDSPYLTTNLAAFWRSWHMTLTNWVRFYVFSPLSRYLMTRTRRLPPLAIVFIAQFSTMLIIGLWHGVSLTFIIWGAWHGLGLFVHKAWNDNTRRWQRKLSQRPIASRLWSAGCGLLTFQYVMLGWVWFALPDFQTALSAFGRLFGVSG